MSYQIIAVFQVLHTPDRAAQTLAEAAFDAFHWNAAEPAGEQLCGHCNTDSGLSYEDGRLTLLIDRSLSDDSDCLRPDIRTARKPLEWHLEHQFFLEIEGDHEDRLREAGLMLLSARPTANNLGEEERAAFDAACAAWEQRARERMERMDLEAHARVLARLGRPADPNWPPSVKREYETTVREVLRRTLGDVNRLLEGETPLGEVADKLAEVGDLLTTARQ